MDLFIGRQPPYMIGQPYGFNRLGLTLAYSFQEVHVDVIKDTIERQVDATNNGTLVVQSTRGLAREFTSADDDHIDQPVDDDTIFTNDFSLCAWVNPTSVSSGNQFIIDKRTGGNFGVIMFFNDAELRGFIDNAGPTASGVMVANEWQCCGMSRIGDQLKIFHNGIEVGSATNANDGSESQSIHFGTRAFSSEAASFDGMMSDIMIWGHRGLSDREMWEVYQSTRRQIWWHPTFVPLADAGVSTALSPVPIHWTPQAPSTKISHAAVTVPVHWAPQAPATKLSHTLSPVSIDWAVVAAATKLSHAVSPVAIHWAPQAPTTQLSTAASPVPIEWVPMKPSTTISHSLSPVPIEWVPVGVSVGGQVIVSLSPVPIDWAPQAPSTTIATSVSPVPIEWTPQAPSTSLSIAVSPVSIEWTTVTLVTAAKLGVPVSYAQAVYVGGGQVQQVYVPGGQKQAVVGNRGG